MYKKSLWENIGDMLTSPGKRFLLGLASVLILGPFGVLIALSVFERQKTYFVNNITVKDQNGTDIPCAILKQKQYAYMPIVPFFCLFFYIPYKTDYYLLKNISAPNMRKGARVNGTVLAVDLLPMERMTKAKTVAVQKDPQILAEELSGKAAQARETFVAETKDFFATDLLEEIYMADHLSLCDLEGMCVLFHYTKINDSYCCIHINKDYAEKIKEDPSFLLELYLTMDPEKLLDNVIVLNDATLERLLRLKQQNEASEADTPEFQSAIAKANQNKKILTKAVIESQLQADAATSNKVIGWLLCIPALGAVELGIAGFITMVIPLGLIFLPLGIWLFYVAIKKIKKGGKNKENVQKGRYKVVQTTCIEATEEAKEYEDETVTYYTTKFANGEINVQQQKLGVEGDVFYLVYLQDAKKVNAIYKGIEYIPAADLPIEMQ